MTAPQTDDSTSALVSVPRRRNRPNRSNDAAAPPGLTCGGLEVTIVGTNGDDVIQNERHDVIAGSPATMSSGAETARRDLRCPGNDYIEGQGRGHSREQGDDILDGGEGGCCIVATNTG